MCCPTKEIVAILDRLFQVNFTALRRKCDICSPVISIVNPTVNSRDCNLFLFNEVNTLERIPILLKVNPASSAGETVKKIEEVFKRVNPESPVDISFVDEEYARKFGNEKRIGELATFFAILAVFISCLGLFGLASFIAEQRTKEIGIRKVLGASVGNLWRMLSQDFIVLVTISSIVAIPFAYYFISDWLKQFEYRTHVSWWIFVISVFGAVTITLLTVSYQAIRASLMNPVKSLRTE